MKFTLAPTTKDFPNVRMVSETGRWELGFWPVMFGTRVRAGLVGSPVCVVDYCAGGDALFQAQLLLCVKDIMETMDESVPLHEVESIWPTFKRKPINFDPCWNNLCELRDKLKNANNKRTEQAGVA